MDLTNDGYDFKDPDAGMIHRGLQQLLGAINDLKDIVVGLDQDVADLRAEMKARLPAEEMDGPG